MGSIKNIFTRPSNLLQVVVFVFSLILAIPASALPIGQGNTGNDWKKACDAPGSGAKDQCCQSKYTDCEESTSANSIERYKCIDAYKMCTLSIVEPTHTAPGKDTNPTHKYIEPSTSTNPGGYIGPGKGTNPGAYIGPNTGTNPIGTDIDPGTPTNPSAYSD